MSDFKEKTIIEVSMNTGYDPKVVELLYDFTNGDQEGIEKILASIHKNIVIIKANFESKTIDKKGFFYLAYDSGQYQVIEKGFFAFSHFENIDLQKSWDDLRKSILNFKMQDKFDKKMWSFYDREMGREAFLREMERLSTDFISKGNKFKTLLETLLGKVLAPVFYHKNFAMNMEIEFLDPFLFFKPLENPKEEESEEEKPISTNSEEENIIANLKVFPILDPINGKNIKDVRPDDPILFEVKDERETAYYIADLLQKKSRAGLIGKIQGYSIVDQDSLKLKIYFAPGIWGESIVSNTLRVRVLTETENQQENIIDSENKFIKIPYKPFLTGIIIIMFIIVFFLLFYS